MGSYVNGVYVPTLAETGWSEEVDDFLTNMGREYVNVRQAPYGAEGDNAADDVNAVQAAVDAGIGTVRLPPGTYKFGDGSGVVLPDACHITGVPGKTFITVKNAYAFTGTSRTNVVIENLFIAVRSGSTTGGAVKSIGQNNNSWRIRDVYADAGAAAGTLTTPLYHFQGWIGNLIENSQASSGSTGYHLDATGFCNSNTVRRCRAAGQSSRGILVTGEGNNLVQNIWESNTGYGVEVVDGSRTVISGSHFEDCGNHGVYSHGDTAGTVIHGNAFWSYRGGAPAGTRFIYLDGSSGAHASRQTVIDSNQFYNATTMLEIGTGVDGTAVLWNEGLRMDDSSIVDSGTNTNVFVGNTGSVGKIQQTARGRLSMVGPASSPGGSALFQATRSNGNEQFYVTETGYAVFRTVDGDPGTSTLASGTFCFYQDAADANKIKVRVRKADGSYLTGTVVTPT